MKTPHEPWIWDPAHECLPLPTLRAVQARRLVAAVRRAHAVPHYKGAFERAGLTPDDVTGLSDLRRLPFTTKDDLRRGYPFPFLAVEQSRVVRVHASSGTTGKPTVVSYTARDIDLWADVVARALAASGVRPGVAVHNAYGYGLFTGGLGFQYGAERIGALVVPAAGADARRQVAMLRDFGSTVLLSTPSVAATLLEAAADEGIAPRTLHVTAGVFGGEPWSDALRVRIEAGFGLRAHDTYGLSEVIGPGVAHACGQGEGLHLYEDHFLPEVIDPETGEPLPDGEEGELVLTALTREAMPLLRYRTRDRTRLRRDPCACGRTLARIERVAGRLDDALVVRGAAVLPNEVEEVLLRFEELSPHWRMTAVREQDRLEVGVESAQTLEPAARSALERRVGAALAARFGAAVAVVMPPRSVPRSAGKAVRIVAARS